MSADRRRIRQLRKQALRLHAQHYRLALRQEWNALAEPFSSKSGGSETRHWLGIFGGLVSILPSKWRRILSVGVLAWRLLSRIKGTRSARP